MKAAKLTIHLLKQDLELAKKYARPQHITVNQRVNRLLAIYARMRSPARSDFPVNAMYGKSYFASAMHSRAKTHRVREP